MKIKIEGKYSHFVLISSPNSTANNLKCAQHDFMFRRHCFMADWMGKSEQFEWILFFDGDIAGVNPHRKVEELMGNDNVELIFINRGFNSKISAGSYLAKNSPFVRQFLHSWANFVLPSSFHGSDNGAIHALFLEKYALLEYRNECQHLQESSKLAAIWPETEEAEARKRQTLVRSLFQQRKTFTVPSLDQIPSVRSAHCADRNLLHFVAELVERKLTPTEVSVIKTLRFPSQINPESVGFIIRQRGENGYILMTIL